MGCDSSSSVCLWICIEVWNVQGGVAQTRSRRTTVLAAAMGRWCRWSLRGASDADRS